MADIDTQIRDFLQIQDEVMDKWKLYVVNPFSTAYDIAHASLKTYIELQEKADAAHKQPTVAPESASVLLRAP